MVFRGNSQASLDPNFPTLNHLLCMRNSDLHSMSLGG
jgi:hypothetical protein